ncbi:hypothetical protein [Flavobacterium sp. AG291]|uniref:hypothetical protein n=1 Tax=Flavobacterium sp. AG291 TaxID=2184000 RepID=UPI000E0C7262|nr:hypothetical protein [Flavobacterium sp. AG291]RDI07044.1 hypothetical protein DEU42_113144 [Flavobacterium sp. AG291]
MTGTTKNKKGLGNPAVLAVASSPAGQQAISNISETQRKVTDAGIQILPFVFKTLFVAGCGYVAYRLWTDRFIKLGTNPNWPASNINDAQADARAEAIYQAMVGFGADKDAVAMNIAGLNYNGWVKVYNAFGNREGILPFSKEMNLVEWINDQFSGDDLLELRVILPGVF